MEFQESGGAGPLYYTANHPLSASFAASAVICIHLMYNNIHMLQEIGQVTCTVNYEDNIVSVTCKEI